MITLYIRREITKIILLYPKTPTVTTVRYILYVFVVFMEFFSGGQKQPSQVQRTVWRQMKLQQLSSTWNLQTTFWMRSAWVSHLWFLNSSFGWLALTHMSFNFPLKFTPMALCWSLTWHTPLWGLTRWRTAALTCPWTRTLHPWMR